jgi:hypothetical protein
MKLKLSDLRRMIFEEIDRLVRRSAGFGGSSGLGGRGKGSIEVHPFGLGDEEHQEEEYGKEQQKNQFAPRVDGRRTKTRQD